MPHLEFGDKIVLPPKILLELQCLKIPTPLLFMVRSASQDLHFERYPDVCTRQYCSVQEFSAPDGQVFLPYWLMQNLRVPEGDWVVVTSVVNLPRGIYCRFQPESTSFLDLAAEIGPKLLMETALRRYSVLSMGSTIVIEYGTVRYHVQVAELKPAPVVSLCGDVDLETDFMPPEFQCTICNEKILCAQESKHRHCPDCFDLFDSDKTLQDHQRDEHITSFQPLLAQGRMRRKGDTSALRSSPLSRLRCTPPSNNDRRTPPPSPTFLLPTRMAQQGNKLRTPKSKARLNPQLRSLPQQVTKVVALDRTGLPVADLCISSVRGTSHRALAAPPRLQATTRVRRRPATKLPPSARLDKLS
ncbi:ubiquitin fusion degradation protein, putative [Phytophthora infestans T30-4]|uniref:Ubiquitin fusion degradation protein, putative n=1 Tax=Phytophthora infestans (strain T30-4) TaxID=403677 RepID=D0NPR1_PHYIT|nr:ubiquitin fusion degradation protein, putative [Phytophthora infestans T30-4]EEY62623.1 ubiquitin fusion degradation protein, putative [Phytophthora infestans T30-4]|eukprot:XP_002898865.1 ubiquitin fusion degradation protein, putative [Phytophthora infestans T30-4]